MQLNNMEKFLEKFYDDVWQQMAINVDKEMMGTHANDFFEKKPVTLELVLDMTLKKIRI
jgi:hypothetical protein